MFRDLTSAYFCDTISGVMEEKLDVKGIRKELGMTQKVFAEELGVDEITVSRWERGERRPSRLALRSIERLRRKVGKA